VEEPGDPAEESGEDEETTTVGAGRVLEPEFDPAHPARGSAAMNTAAR